MKGETNPLHIILMEKWITTLPAFVGYAQNRDIYLTWDVRDIPVFSRSCKIGYDIKMETFKMFRNTSKMVGRIEYVKGIDYKLLGDNKTYTFNVENLNISSTYVPEFYGTEEQDINDWFQYIWKAIEDPTILSEAPIKECLDKIK